MLERIRQDQWLTAATIGGATAALLGAMVLVGWYTGEVSLLQVAPQLVAMQYNTALCFLLSGSARILAATGHRFPALAAAGMVFVLAFLTLLGYLGVQTLPVDSLMWHLGVDYSMVAYTLSKTSAPGRMAPNTALCFVLNAFSMLVIAGVWEGWGRSERWKGWWQRWGPITAAMLGTIVMGLGIIAFLGYIGGTPTAYGWGKLARMALHTSIGMIILGLTTVILAGAVMQEQGDSLERRIPMLVGTGGIVVTLGVAQALAELTEQLDSTAPLLALVLGLVLTATVVQVFRFARDTELRENELRLVNARLAIEIAERRLTQEALTMHADELARSNEELERFAYVASHDLQEPLRMVASYTKLIEQKYKGQLDEQADQYIHFAVDGAVRMQKLIQGLLAFSRAGSQPLERKLVRMDEVANQALSNLGDVVNDSKASVTIAPLPTIYGDEIQLCQVFQNLIGNALKFRGDSVPDITITSAELDDSWEFAVSDNGIGIDPKDADRIFMVFRRLHTHHEYPGTGIGLSLAKKIVERHGGTVRVDSTPGQGATFYFTIPKKA